MPDTEFSNYRATVQAIADDVIQAAREGGDPSQTLAEAVDGNYFVIYTHAALATLRHSRHDDAIFDRLGSDALADCNSMAEVYTKAAYCALEVDVLEELSDRGFDPYDPDSYREEEEEEAE